MSFAASTQVDNSVLFNESQMFPDKTSQEYKFYNRAKTEWACCIAMMSLIRAIISSRSTRAGRKILADFSIDTGAMTNLIQSSRGYLRDLQEECKYWQSVAFAGGRFDHEHPVPLVAVKGGNNSSDSAIGIGRGWYSDYPLNIRERPVKSGNSYSRPSRDSSPRYYTSIQTVWWE